jgi:hypothetical protein
VYGIHTRMDIEKVEKVQMRATKMVQQLKKYSCEAKLRWLNLPTLKYRRLRGDMIQLYDIVSGKYNNQPAVNLNLSHVSNTKGNIYELQLTHLHCNLYVSTLVVTGLL